MSATRSEFAPLNEALLLERLEGDRELAREVVGLFVDDVPTQMAELRAAVEREDAEEAHRLAHGLKGAGANITAEVAQAYAREIEHLARDGRLAEVPERLPHLQAALDAVAREACRLGLTQGD